MPQFKTFDYGNVLSNIENIKGARTRNALAQKQLDPNSVGNQLQREQLSGAKQRNVLAGEQGVRQQAQEGRSQTTFDQGQQKANTEQLYQALTEISQNPAAADYHIPRLKQAGILRGDFDVSNMSLEEIQSKAAEGSAALAKSLGIKPTDKSFTLGQGQQRFDSAGKQIASVAPKASTKAPSETTLQKETIKSNVKRLSELSQNQRQRNLAVEKAKKFLLAFKSGKKSSGAGRTALSYLPGVFTDQAQFDEELSAFAEVAARQKLKASGEIRPTDADVKGMKRAMFGIGRDEQTNINLLKQFISEMGGSDAELEALKAAKAGGQLASFAGGQETTSDLPSGTIDNGDGTFTLPSGQKIRKSNVSP